MLLPLPVVLNVSQYLAFTSRYPLPTPAPTVFHFHSRRVHSPDLLIFSVPAPYFLIFASSFFSFLSSFQLYILYGSRAAARAKKFPSTYRSFPATRTQ